MAFVAMTSRLLLSVLPVLAALAFPLRGADQPPATSELTPLSAEAAKRAVDQLTSMDATTRRRAADAVVERGWKPGGKEEALKLLETARSRQTTAVEAVVKRGAPGLARLKEAHDDWAEATKALMELIKTDYKKAPAKIAMLTKEHAAVDRLRKSMDRGLAAAEAAWKPLGAATDSLNELDRAAARIKSPGATFGAKPPEELLKDMASAEAVLEGWGILAARKAEAALQKTVFEHNKASKWAPKSVLEFAGILNDKRAAVGLPPLRLDERLSSAALDHSKEMQDMGYFSHESPVDANKWPDDRAKNANFEGRFTGENIAMGQQDAKTVYDGWWGSDGHRFIMYASDPNTLGAGQFGRYWTMMTGDKKWE